MITWPQSTSTTTVQLTELSCKTLRIEIQPGFYTGRIMATAIWCHCHVGSHRRCLKRRGVLDAGEHFTWWPPSLNQSIFSTLCNEHWVWPSVSWPLRASTSGQLWEFCFFPFPPTHLIFCPTHPPFSVTFSSTKLKICYQGTGHSLLSSQAQPD